MDRKAAINFARVGAQKLWAGTVTIHANAKTGAHHHGHLESVIYVVQGPRPHALGRAPGVHRRGRAGRLHLRAALRAAPGDQRQPDRAAGMRAVPQRRRGRGGQPRHRAGRRSPSRCSGSTRPIPRAGCSSPAHRTSRARALTSIAPCIAASVSAQSYARARIFLVRASKMPTRAVQPQQLQPEACKPQPPFSCR